MDPCPSSLPRRQRDSTTNHFWDQFKTSPVAALPPQTFEADTELLGSLCRELCNMATTSEVEVNSFPLLVNHLQQVSDVFGFESPLTPVAASPDYQNSFAQCPLALCVCGRCVLREEDDFYEGKCGTRVLCKSPYSFVHVNLSRKLSSCAELLALVRPLFKAEHVRLRMVPGDAGGSAVFLTRDPKEERQIRRILRSSAVRLEKGIRIFLVDKVDLLTWR